MQESFGYSVLDLTTPTNPTALTYHDIRFPLGGPNSVRASRRRAESRSDDRRVSGRGARGLLDDGAVGDDPDGRRNSQRRRRLYPLGGFLSQAFEQHARPAHRHTLHRVRHPPERRDGLGRQLVTGGLSPAQQPLVRDHDVAGRRPRGPGRELHSLPDHRRHPGHRCVPSGTRRKHHGLLPADVHHERRFSRRPHDRELHGGRRSGRRDEALGPRGAERAGRRELAQLRASLRHEERPRKGLGGPDLASPVADGRRVAARGDELGSRCERHRPVRPDVGGEPAPDEPVPPLFDDGGSMGERGSELISRERHDVRAPGEDGGLRGRGDQLRLLVRAHDGVRIRDPDVLRFRKRARGRIDDRRQPGGRSSQQRRHRVPGRPDHDHSVDQPAAVDPAPDGIRLELRPRLSRGRRVRRQRRHRVATPPCAGQHPGGVRRQPAGSSPRDHLRPL